MLQDGVKFEENLAVLAVVLMRAHDYKVVVTQQELADAREMMRDEEIQMVVYETDRLTAFDRVCIEFRHRSRRVLQGEVVYGGAGGTQKRS